MTSFTYPSPQLPHLENSEKKPKSNHYALKKKKGFQKYSNDTKKYKQAHVWEMTEGITPETPHQTEHKHAAKW